MPKSDYLQSADAAFAAQLTLFKNTIGSYAATVGVTPAQVTAQANDTAYFIYALACLNVADGYGSQWAAYKTLVRTGGGSSTPPEELVLPTAVTAVAPGIEKRFRALVQSIKKNANYNTAMGEALGIESAEQSGPDFATLKPKLKLEVSGAGVKVGWGWQGQSKFLDLIEIHVDRGSGFTLLTYDTTPNYLDTAPLPTTPEKWTYKAIFRVADQRVGQWSDEVSITVAG